MVTNEQPYRHCFVMSHVICISTNVEYIDKKDRGVPNAMSDGTINLLSAK